MFNHNLCSLCIRFRFTVANFCIQLMWNVRNLCDEKFLFRVIQMNCWTHFENSNFYMTIEGKTDRSWLTWSCPSFFPSPLLTCCSIRTTSLDGKGPIWADDRSDSLHRLSPSWGFPWFSSVTRWISGDLCTAPGIISLPSLTRVYRRDWLGTRGKWPFARNPDRSWWHRHSSLKLFWPQIMAPWTTGNSKLH